MTKKKQQKRAEASEGKPKRMAKPSKKDSGASSRDESPKAPAKAKVVKAKKKVSPRSASGAESSPSEMPKKGAAQGKALKAKAKKAAEEKPKRASGKAVSKAKPPESKPAKSNEKATPARQAKAKAEAPAPTKRARKSRTQAEPTLEEQLNDPVEPAPEPRSKGGRLTLVEEPALVTPDDPEVDVVPDEVNGASALDLEASEEVGDLDDESYLKGVIEALLFSADHPMSAKELARAAQLDRKRATELVELLRKEYENRGLRIELVADGYCFRTHARYRSFVQKFLSLRPVRLSRAQLETLAIVAYRQPVTRPEVDDVRGVDSGQVLKGLLERDLVKILGKKDEPGRPMLYGTSAGFLELFNLTSLKELPSLREFTELSQESRQKYEAELGEDAPAGPVAQEETNADFKVAEDDSSNAEESGVASETLGTDASSSEGEVEQSGEEGRGNVDSDLADPDEPDFGDGGDSDKDSDDEEDDSDEDDSDEDDSDEDDSDEDDSDEDDSDEDDSDDEEDSDDDDLDDEDSDDEDQDEE